MTKRKITLPESQLEILKGISNVDDITKCVIGNQENIVKVTCMTFLNKTSSEDKHGEVFEIGVVFDGIGELPDNTRYFVGHLRIKDKVYRFEKRRFYYDNETKTFYILAKGSNQIPIS